MDIKVGLSTGQTSLAAEQEALVGAVAIKENDSSQLGFKSESQFAAYERSVCGMPAMEDLLKPDPGDLTCALRTDICHEICCAVLSGSFGQSRVDILVCTPGRLMDHVQYTPGFTLQVSTFTMRKWRLSAWLY